MAVETQYDVNPWVTYAIYVYITPRQKKKYIDFAYIYIHMYIYIYIYVYIYPILSPLWLPGYPPNGKIIHWALPTPGFNTLSASVPGNLRTAAALKNALNMKTD